VRPEEFEPTFDAYLARVHPADQAATQETIRQAFAAHTPFDIEERIVCPDGSIRVLHHQGRWVVDGSERPVKLVGICQDVTERRRADDLLRRSEERFQIVARATNDAIWDWDLAARDVWWNQAITTVFGYPAEAITASVEWRLARVHPDDADAVTSGIQTVMDRHEQFWSGEYRFRRSDGSFADVFDRAFVMYDEKGTPARVIGAMADVSERKRTLELLEQRVASRTHELLGKNLELEGEIGRRRTVERLLRTKNDELKAFAYTVSHDLKAPLRGIAGYAQELDRRHRSGLGERALHCLQQIVAAARSLDRLIDDLLHYARLEAETAAESTVDLTRVVEAILRDRQRVILAQQAEITIRLCTTSVRTWERGIVQVLTNLIDNALKYSREARPPRIGITSEQQNSALLIAISDNGIGFDMKYHDRMFGLFNRLVRQEEYEGTGAGLAIVKKVIDKLGGRVWAESKPGAGAAFFVSVPTTLAPGEGDAR